MHEAKRPAWLEATSALAVSDSESGFAQAHPSATGIPRSECMLGKLRDPSHYPSMRFDDCFSYQIGLVQLHA